MGYEAKKLFEDTQRWAQVNGWKAPSAETKNEAPFSDRAIKITRLIRSGDWGCAKSRVHELAGILANEPLPPLLSSEDFDNPGPYTDNWRGKLDADGEMTGQADFESTGDIVVVLEDATDPLEVGEILLLDAEADVDDDSVTNVLRLNGSRHSDAVLVSEVRPATYEECRKVAWVFRDRDEEIVPYDFQPQNPVGDEDPNASLQTVSSVGRNS